MGFLQLAGAAWAVGTDPWGTLQTLRAQPEHGTRQCPPAKHHPTNKKHQGSNVTHLLVSHTHTLQRQAFLQPAAGPQHMEMKLRSWRRCSGVHVLPGRQPILPPALLKEKLDIKHL